MCPCPIPRRASVDSIITPAASPEGSLVPCCAVPCCAPHRARAATVVAGSKLEDAKVRVALVAPLASYRCPLPFGGRSLQQSFLNRHDFARMHSFDFHLYPVSREAADQGTWYRFQALKEVRSSLLGFLLSV